jgi:hypothetical protein
MVINSDKLSFGDEGNSKLSKDTATFSLPAGYTCPWAKDCLSMADRVTGKITDGANIKFRCFSATTECRLPSVRNARWNNLEILKRAESIENMGILIQESIPKGFTKVRIHVSGDFFNEKYFLAWLNVAINHPEIIFYGYTKALKFLVKYKNEIPPNFRFTASIGGKNDSLIKKHNLKYADVVFSVKEANEKGLEIDHDDSHCISLSKKSFCALLHGCQPAKSLASKAMSELRKTGWTGYGKNQMTTKDKKTFVVYVGIKVKSTVFTFKTPA